MARRGHISRRGSKRLFRKTADLIHKKNNMTAPMRGGIRL